jgi:hypothetical protein
MPLVLPAPLRDYFDGNAALDVSAMLASFAPDTVVHDEQKTHRGSGAIKSWIEQATVGNQAIATPQAIQSDGHTHRVVARVAGAFAGSPLTLTFTFRVERGRVFGQDRSVMREAVDALRDCAGNFYINDKPTGAVVGQQPFGGGQRSGTNDKAGSALNLRRWTSPRTIKETYVPPLNHSYPSMRQEDCGE